MINQQSRVSCTVTSCQMLSAVKVTCRAKNKKLTYGAWIQGHQAK